MDTFQKSEIFDMIHRNGSVAFDLLCGILLLFYIFHDAFHYSTLIFFFILPLAGSSLLLSYPKFDLRQLQTEETTILVLLTVIITTIGARYTKSRQISSRLSIGLLATALLLLIIEPAVRTNFTSYYKTPPRVDIKNGTLEGIHLPEFSEDVFLGIPFASSPIEELRLRRPVPYHNAWNGTRDATKRGVNCPGYGPMDDGLNLGEGMLHIAANQIE
jgi:hypothetical protein